MDGQESPDNTKKIVASVIVLLAVVMATVGVNALSKKKTDTHVSADTSTTSGTSSTNKNGSGTNTATSDSTQAYADGTYSATGSYASPGGTQTIKVSVTIQDNVVTATSAQGQAHDPDAEIYQQSFIEGYKSLVVGKKLSGINLSRVSGSSLTSNGFNNALDQIKDKAQV